MMAEQVSLAILQPIPPASQLLLSMADHGSPIFGQHGTRPENPVKADFRPHP
jgi:hypothetical protein